MFPHAATYFPTPLAHFLRILLTVAYSLVLEYRVMDNVHALSADPFRTRVQFPLNQFITAEVSTQDQRCLLKSDLSPFLLRLISID